MVPCQTGGFYACLPICLPMSANVLSLPACLHVYLFEYLPYLSTFLGEFCYAIFSAFYVL